MSSGSTLARIEFRYWPPAFAVAGIVVPPMRRQLAILARMPVRSPSSPRYAPHSQAAIATSTGESSGNRPIVP
ncbi:hypothetical protein D3C83_104850 [compost metagenome]